MRIKPIKGIAVTITGVNKSEDGAHDFEALSIELVSFLEQGPGWRLISTDLRQ